MEDGWFAFWIAVAFVGGIMFTGFCMSSSDEITYKRAYLEGKYGVPPEYTVENVSGWRKGK